MVFVRGLGNSKIEFVMRGEEISDLVSLLYVKGGSLRTIKVV
jgi:hypothetical protein